jgi:hypothetical protein
MIPARLHRTAILLSSFISVFSLHAATFHIAPEGDDHATGNEAAPFKTLEAAVSKVSAGDSIIVASGTYTCSVTIILAGNGTADRPIAILGALESRPVFDFSSMPLASSNQGIKLSGTFWHIKGIIIKGAGDNGLLIQGGCNNVIDFCDFLENQDTGCQLKGGAADNSIINCDSYNNRDPDEGDADGFAPKMDVGSNNVFIGCRAWQNSDDGWDGYLRGTNNVTTRLENCWCFNNGYRADGSASTGNGNGFKMGGSDDKTLKHDFVLIRCLAFGNRVKGFDQNNNRGAMTLYNCTAFSNGTNYSIDGTSSTLTLKNSIASGSGSNRLSGGVQAANSLTAAQSHFISVDPQDAWEPRKADGTLPDIFFMHLAENSDLIDVGEIIDGVSYNGEKPDLGCFETVPPTSLFLNRNITAESYVPFYSRNRNLTYTLDGRSIGNDTFLHHLSCGSYIRTRNKGTGISFMKVGFTGETQTTPCP